MLRVWLVAVTLPRNDSGIGVHIHAGSTRSKIRYCSAVRQLTQVAFGLNFIESRKLQNFGLDFYRAAWNADAVLRWEFRPSVCPSVCPSDAWIVTKRQICLDFYTIRKIIYPSFLRKRMFGGGDPFYLKYWVNEPPLERNRWFWTDNR